MLTLLIIIHDRSREIPDNRSDLYSACAELLFERWDSYRNITPSLPERYRINDLLKHVAALLSEDEQYGGRLSRDQLREIAKQFFLNDYLDNREGKASEASHKLIEHLTGRAWILQEAGNGIFEFTHRTFLEFFYARHIESKHERTEDMLQALQAWIAKGERVLPCHLSIQIRVKDKRDASGRAARWLASTLEKQPNSNAAIFCAQSLNYLLPPAEDIQALVKVICNVSLQYGWGAALIPLLNTRSPLSEIFLRPACEQFIAIRTVKDMRRFNDLVDFLAFSDFRTLRGDIFENTIRKWLLQLVPLAIVSPYISKIQFDVLREISPACIQKHGHRIWGDLNGTSRRIDTRLRDAEGIFESIQAQVEGRPSEQSKLYLQLADQIANSLQMGFKPVRVPHSLRIGSRRIEAAPWFHRVPSEFLPSLLIATMLHTESLPAVDSALWSLVDSVQQLVEMRSEEIPKPIVDIWTAWRTGNSPLFHGANHSPYARLARRWNRERQSGGH